MGEFNQGIPAASRRKVAGKDALFRLLMSSSEPQGSNIIPVTFDSASLQLRKPSGDEVTFPAQFYTDIFSNAPDVIEPSERHNINFYLSGDELDEEDKRGVEAA